MTRNRISSRTVALAGASISALVLAALLPRAASAQSFQGTGTATSGLATISTGTGTTNIQVDSNETVIDWVATGSGSVMTFQPAGTTASFTTGSGFTGSNYTVLNRIVTQDALGTPTNSAIQFDGTVQSDLGGTTGGNIWFYSPNGIVVGSTAQFSVGGLVLTTNPIDTTDGLYGPTGEIRFTSPSNPAAMVSIASGAQITASLNSQAPGNSSYVAIVAPRIEQGGSVRADGPIAYVAAEAADIVMNAGMFDIAVTSGTGDSNGIVHTGSTGGSASAGTADPRVIRMVAVSKNDGLTMLLSGNIGYDAAALATDDGSAVILTAGHGTVDSVDPLTAPGNITIGNASFTSTTTANATGTILVAPTVQTAFARTVQFNALDTVRLDALGGASIQASDPVNGVAMIANAGHGETGGTIAVNVGGGGSLSVTGGLELYATGDGGIANSASPDATGGSVTLVNTGGTISAGDLVIDASAYGGTGTANGGSAQGGTIAISSSGALNIDYLSLNADAYGGSNDYPDSTGGAASGGSIQLSLTGTATLPATYLSASAEAYGSFGSSAGGTGRGGTVDIAVGATASLGNAASLYVYTDGHGGNGNVTGGDGYGGSATLTANGGALGLDYVSFSASGTGARSSGQAGSGFGGTAKMALNGGTYDWYGINLTAEAYAGDGYYPSGMGGNATSSLTGGAQLALSGASLTLAGELSLSANAYGAVDGPAGSTVAAGHAGLSLANGSALTVDGATTITARAGFRTEGFGTEPNTTPTLTGGNATLLVNGSSFDSSDVSVSASAQGLGALTTAGTVTGGTAQLTVSNGGTLQVRANSSYGYAGSLSVDAGATSDYQTFINGNFGTMESGIGAAAIGGTALLSLAGGTVTVDGTGTVSANGTGGPGGAGISGSGTGGNAAIAISGGTMSLYGALAVTAEGHGGSNGAGLGTGNATGGSAAIDVGSGGALNVQASLLSVSAQALAADVLTTGSAGAGGNALGGTARLASSGGSIFVEGDTQILADGTGGASYNAVGGAGTGGTATIAGTGAGTLTLNGLVNVTAAAIGGQGNGTAGLGGNATGGSALIDQSGTGGLLHAGSTVTVDATATGGFSAANAAPLGTATGGIASLLSRGGTLQIDGNASLDASAASAGSAVAPTPASVAGLVQLGSGGGATGGTLTIAGMLSARAVGDSARADGYGFRGGAVDAPITIGGQTSIATTGSIDFAMTGTGVLASTGTLSITSTLGAVTGTGALSSAGDIAITAPGGITFSRLSAGGATWLQSPQGAVSIADLLSIGGVTVSGASVAIGSTGSLAFDAITTGGDLWLSTAGDLVVDAVDAPGAVTLSSSAGQVRAGGAINGASVAVTAGTDIVTAAPVTATGNLAMTALGGISTSGALRAGGDLSLSAGTGNLLLGGAIQAGGSLTVTGGANVTSLAALSAGTALNLAAGSLLSLGGMVSGQTITASSADIALLQGGQIGQRGITQTVSLINSAAGSTTQLGGVGGNSGGYVLDASEFARIFADRSISIATGAAGQAGDMIVNALPLAFGASGQIGTGGSLNLSSPGRVVVTGPVALQTSSAADGLGIVAGSLDVVTDSGGIVLADSAGIAQGQLTVTADRFVIASSAAIAALNQTNDIAAINSIMGNPPATAGSGSVSAGSIAVTVGSGFYVQNTGASTAYNDRRGFTAGALSITTGSPATRIVINGVVFDANGQIVTGFENIPITGGYAPGSSINGCAIGLNCGEVPEALNLAKGDLQGALDPEDTPTAPLAQIGAAPITVDVPEFQRGENLPLVDDPVTGIGNEDLWGACPAGAQGCAGDSDK